MRFWKDKHHQKYNDYCGSRARPNLDIDGDGKIDLKDYFITTKNYGKS
jgi:hypothetical protein